MNTCDKECQQLMDNINRRCKKCVSCNKVGERINILKHINTIFIAFVVISLIIGTVTFFLRNSKNYNNVTIAAIVTNLVFSLFMLILWYIYDYNIEAITMSLPFLFIGICHVVTLILKSNVIYHVIALVIGGLSLLYSGLRLI